MKNIFAQSKVPSSSLQQCERGVAFIEFAICLPFLMVLFFGSIEVSRYFLAIQKVEKTLDLVTDIIGQADQTSSTQNLTQAGLDSLFSIAPEMMSPYEMGARGKIIITSVSMSNINTGVYRPIVNWQACGGGTNSAVSAFGTASGDKANPNNATLPGSFTMQPDEEALLGEIYYNFSPILLQDIIGDQQLSRRVFFVPRIGSLASFDSTCP